MIRLLIAMLAVLVAACGANRPATRYEVWSWSIAIPDDLGVRPANDREGVWKDGPLFITSEDDPTRTLHVRVEPLQGGNSTGATALELLQEVASGADSEEIGPVTSRQFPVGDGAVVHAVRLGLNLDIVYIVARDQLITVTASAMTPADVLFIADSFAFRDPPGDPGSPPPTAAGPPPAGAA